MSAFGEENADNAITGGWGRGLNIHNTDVTELSLKRYWQGQKSWEMGEERDYT